MARKKSIRRRINRIIIGSIIILAVFMAGMNLFLVDWYTDRSSDIMMKKTCSAQALQLNNQLKLVEQSVQNIYDISEKLRPSIEDMKSIEVTNHYIQQFQKMAITIADNTEGAICVYYRINPDLNANGEQGFFFVKSPETGLFMQEASTNILDYDVNDVEHVGWYYIPVWKGQPVWMDPYFNANVGIQMISYVVPVYDGVKLVGVVGMDVDFGRLIDITEDVDIYESSGAVLCSLSNSKIYYNKCNALGDNIPTDFYRILQGSDSSEKILRYNNGSDKYAVQYETLDDRMKIIVYAKISDINVQAWVSIVISGIILFVAFVFDLFIAMRLAKKITDPIKDVTAAAKEYAQGNWDSKVSCNTNDEIQELTDSISIMAEKTKEYIDYIHDMARKDGLTGLRNKRDYILYVDKIKADYAVTGKDFAVVVCDVNNLKTVNDSFGHEAGDELLLRSSKYICKIFAHSPIFRVGGDEFVVIIDSGDFDSKESLVDEFTNYMRLSKNSSDWKDICVACGMAVSGADGNSYEDVFKTADIRMYENKTELKGGVKPR